MGGIARVDPGRFRRGFFAWAAKHPPRRAPCGPRYSLRPRVTPFTIAENRKIRPGGPKGDWARPRADVRGGGLARVHQRPVHLWRPSGASARPACGGQSPMRVCYRQKTRRWSVRRAASRGPRWPCWPSRASAGSVGCPWPSGASTELVGARPCAGARSDLRHSSPRPFFSSNSLVRPSWASRAVADIFGRSGGVRRRRGRPRFPVGRHANSSASFAPFRGRRPPPRSKFAGSADRSRSFASAEFADGR